MILPCAHMTVPTHPPQVTFQACDIQEARHLYDHLAVVCPIMVRGREGGREGGMCGQMDRDRLHW